MSFKNKTCLIVGGSEGIGYAIAENLQKEGAKIILASRALQKLEQAKEKLQNIKEANDVTVYPLDITKHEAMTSFVCDFIKTHGAPDYLINTAGFARPGYIHEMDFNFFEQMIQLNYLGTARLCHAFIPHFIEAKKGHILLTSSLAGFFGLFGYSGYCASKWAVLGFAQSLRHELKEYGIKVSTLCPPNTDTPGFAEENKYKPAEVLKLEEKMKSLSAEAVAKAALKGLAKGTSIIIPGTGNKLNYLAAKLLPQKIVDMFLKKPK
ncbi:MAG: SDR family oxidoreductase [bacterium]|nr:SDR family oxidoreductase [bacterium]MBU1917459.1 SDR family oxidoreductase [bacterium]